MFDLFRKTPMRLLVSSLEVFISACLFALMLITVIDVIGRYFFSSPLAGAVELTELVLAAMIFSALPLVTARSEHVEVDLFTFLVPRAARRWQEALVNLVSAVAVGAVAYEMFQKASEVSGYGEVTAALRIPIAPLGYLMAAMTGLVSAVFFFIALRVATRTRS